LSVGVLTEDTIFSESVSDILSREFCEFGRIFCLRDLSISFYNSLMKLIDRCLRSADLYGLAVVNKPIIVMISNYRDHFLHSGYLIN